MNTSFLNEAFQSLKILNEENFDLNAEKDITRFTELVDSDIDDTIEVIDPEADTVEDLADSYEGKVILDCCVCHSMVYKDPADIKIDDAADLANEGEECPYCYATDGFKIVGQVAAFKPEDEVKVEIEKKDTEEIEEPLKETMILRRKPRKMSESFDKIEIETETDKIKVETAPRDDNDNDNSQMIVPIEPETKDEINNDQPESDLEDEEVDVLVDDFDEESFDELGESLLKENYDNVESYKTKSVHQYGNKLFVEGAIKFKSGSVKKTGFVFESKNITRSKKATFIGENLQLKNNCKMLGRIDGSLFIPESLQYRIVDDGKTKCGSVVKKKN